MTDHAAVRYTDFDALSSRLAAAAQGYYADDYLLPFVDGLKLALSRAPNVVSPRRLISQNFSPSALRAKYPIIKRGTYVRSVAVDKMVAGFLAANSPAQVLSIGAGSDTRAFGLLPQHQHLKYVEVDFPDSVALKKSVIGASALLLRPVAQGYSLVGGDLTVPGQFAKIMQQNLDPAVPTLVISECVLCYLPEAAARQVVAEAGKYFDHGSIVVYDPGNLTDKFGEIMLANLAHRGIKMRQMAPLAGQLAQLQQELGHVTRFAADTDFIYNHWVSKQEQARISGLELVDELEEWVLLARHYVLMVGVWSKSDAMDEYIESVRQMEWQVSE